MTQADGPDGGGQPPRPNRNRDDEVNWGNFLSLGLTVAVGVGLGLLVGGWLDRKYHWAPWGTVVGSMLGLASGLYLLIRDTIRMNKD
jgi:F0F1-type ATP synthase assembly protein I